VVQTTPERPKRRRRTPEEAEREILDATDGLLRERPFHELTVGQIMGRTTLSRKSFYVYFRDRYELLTRLVAPLRARLDEANAIWFTEGGSGRDSLRAVARIVAEDGALIRELADAARYDQEAERVWRAFNDPVIEGAAARIRAQAAKGRLNDIDPEATARALVGMNLYTFFDRVVGNPDADVEAIADSLSAIWQRVLRLG
jgi:AcrR family transcriptional regulator